MKATLKFKLPDEEHEWMMAVRARETHLALCEFGEYLRTQYKYTEPEDRDDLVAVRDKWYQIMGDLLEP